LWRHLLRLREATISKVSEEKPMKSLGLQVLGLERSY